MIYSNFIKLIFAALLFSAVNSCGLWRAADQKTASTEFAPQIGSKIPFETKEPEIYECEIVISTYSAGETSERTIKAARNGLKMRFDYPNGVSFIQTEREHFRLFKDDKIFAQDFSAANNKNENGETLQDFLTTEWLSARRGAGFEKIGVENGLTKYRVQIEESSNSEVFIYVDENLRFPVKQEFYSITGAEKTLLSAMEIRNLNLNTGESAFSIPEDYKKVTSEEFARALARQKQ